MLSLWWDEGICLYEYIGSLMLIMKADESRKVHMKETSVWRKTVSEKTQKHVLSFSGFYQQQRMPSFHQWSRPLMCAGDATKKSTAMKDSWRLVVVDGPLIVSAECHKNWYRTFQEILKIWVCRKWEFQSRPATAIDHQCSCLTTFPLPICTHKLLLAQSKGTATWDSGPLG